MRPEEEIKFELKFREGIVEGLNRSYANNEEEYTKQKNCIEILQWVLEESGE